MPDHAFMQRAGEIITTRFKVFGQISKMRDKWGEIAGEVLAAHAEPVFIKNKVLHVLCDSPAWAQQLEILSPAIVARIKSVTGLKLEKVEGKFGMVQIKPQRKKAARVFQKPDIDPEDIIKLKDPELAKAIRQLIATDRSETEEGKTKL